MIPPEHSSIPPDSPPRLIVVLGMHRSGTSVLTRSLAVLGVHLGDSLMVAVEGNNDKGFFEDIEFNAINVELMEYLGFDWHGLKSIPDDELKRPDLEPLRQRALAFLGKRRAESPVSAVKDPRLCITLAFWQPLFQRAGFEVSYLIALRHPLSVQQSLSRRDGLAAEKCHYLWLKYMLASVSQTGGYPRCVVCYDRMMDEPEPQLLRMARHLNLSVQAEALPAFTETFLTESLRHTRFDPTMACHLATMPVDVVSTWTVLDRLARDEWTADDARVAESLHPVACKMRDVEPAFAYATALEQDLARSIRQRDQQQAEWKIRETEWQGIVDSYRHSTSWRITRPLRWLAGKWLALRPFVELVRDYRQRYPGVSGMLRLASRLGQAFGSGGIAGIRTRISTYVGYRNRAADEGLSWHLFQAGEYQVLEPVPDGVALEPVDLAVHLHAYYLDVLPEIRGFLAHMPCAYTLYVTTDTPQKAEVIGSLFQETGNIRKREILVTENRGRDLAPLLIDLGTRVGRHDLVLHLHTKKSPHNGDLAGWRGHLLDTLLGSDADIRAAIDCFQQNPALGLLFPVPYCPVQPYLRSGGNRESMAALLRKTGHPLSDLSRLDDRHFPAGSMFWFRKEAIRPLLAAGLEHADFAPEQGQTDGTLAHAMERLFPYYAAREGFSSMAFLPARLHVPALPGALPLSLNAVEARLAGSPCRVLFDHNEGGGVRQYAKTLMADWLAGHCGVVRVFPAPGAGWVVQVMAGLNCDFYAETDRVAIFSVLSGLRCEGITVNSLFGFPDLARIIDQIIHLADLLAAPLNYTVHDFHAICPSQHLLDTWNRYCGVPDDHKICHRCLSTNPSAARVLNPDHSIASWREPFARLLARSDTVTLFDPSALEILRRAHPPLRPGQYSVEPHVLSHFHCESPLELPRQLHIGVLGTLTEAKGANVLNALARHIRHLRRHIPISVIGRSLVPLDPTIQVLGAYDTHSLTGIVGHQHISVFFMASIIPETFSYTLSEAMAMGLPIVAFDLGAQGRRVRAYHKGCVIPPGASPGDILLALEAASRLNHTPE